MDTTRSSMWRWAFDWAFIGGVTATLAPSSMRLFGSFGRLIPDDYSRVAGPLGAISGLLVGAVLCGLYRRVPRGRVAVLGVLLPVPLGIWGALVASASAWLTAPRFAVDAFLMGSMSAVLQMALLVPVYVVAADRGWRLLPLLLAAVFAPISGILGPGAVLVFFELVRSW